VSQGDRLFLSPPHMSDAERTLLLGAFDSNWVAPLGPHVDAFQREFTHYIGVPLIGIRFSSVAGARATSPL